VAAVRRRLDSFGSRLIALALLGMVLRAITIFVLTPHQLGFGDWHWYDGVANGIARGDWFHNPFVTSRAIPSASHPPLYPLVLSISSLLGGTGYLAHRAMGIVFAAAGIVLMGLLGRRLGGPKVGLLAAGLTAVYPVFVAADGALLAETLFTPVLAATLLVAYRARDVGSARWAAALGVLIALCALTRSESLMLVVLLALPAVWRPASGRAPRIVALLVAFLVVMAPWTIRNVHAFHRLVPVSTQDGALVAGANCPTTYYGPELGGWSFACLSKARTTNEAVQSDVWRREGREYAGDHAGRVPLVVLVRVLKLMDFYEPRRELMFAEGRNHKVEGLGIGLYWLLLPLAAWGAVLLRRRGEPLFLLAAPVVTVLIAAVAGYGVTRLRHAADLVILLLAAVALASLAERRRAPAPPAAAR
jgi:4-amino-4-deoxy-L-arabinose transferase-like glycosyltransferase